MIDCRRFAPATARNRDPILAVLSRVVRAPSAAAPAVLEIASGTGEHAVYLAERLPIRSWQPSDPDPDALASIDAWRAAAAVDRVAPAIRLDVTDEPWP